MRNGVPNGAGFQGADLCCLSGVRFFHEAIGRCALAAAELSRDILGLAGMRRRGALRGLYDAGLGAASAGLDG